MQTPNGAAPRCQGWKEKYTSGVVNAPRRFGVPKHRGLGPILALCTLEVEGYTDQRPHRRRMLPGGEAPGLRYQLRRSKACPRPERTERPAVPSPGTGLSGGSWESGTG